MNRRKIVLVFLLSTLLYSCKQKENADAQTSARVPPQVWQNAAIIEVPPPPGAKSKIRWKFQAALDDCALYLRFIYPQKLPPIGENLVRDFQLPDESLNHLPFVKLFIPPESAQDYDQRPKVTSANGDNLAFAQPGDPEPHFEAHVQFLLRSKSSSGRQKVVSGGTFEKTDILHNPTSVVMGIQAHVQKLRKNGQPDRINFHYERKSLPGPFITDNNSITFRVPLAEKVSKNAAVVEQFLAKPVPDLSLRLYPSGTNRYKLYLPRRIDSF
ncbi:MAG: hypothetical protein ACYST6_14825 [Planctomycetota bacterium]|jgi:hypothetical protein